MTAERLIQLALRNLGNTDPDAEEYEIALEHLNLIISNFAYWDSTIQPLRSIPTLATEINLPPYYAEVFELLLASREGLAYGTPMATIHMFELKAKQLTNKLVYNNLTATDVIINPTTMVV